MDTFSLRYLVESHILKKTHKFHFMTRKIHITGTFSVSLLWKYSACSITIANIKRTLVLFLFFVCVLSLFLQTLTIEDHFPIYKLSHSQKTCLHLGQTLMLVKNIYLCAYQGWSS